MKFFAAASKNQWRSHSHYKPERSLRIRLTCTPQIMCLKKDTASWCKYKARGFRSMIATLRNLYLIFSKLKPAIIKRPLSTSTAPRLIRRAWRFRYCRQGWGLYPQSHRSCIVGKWRGRMVLKGGEWIEARAQYEHLVSRLWTERFILDAGIRWFLGLWA